MSTSDRLGVIERCPACGGESASTPAEVFCVRCATEDYAITEQRLKVARFEEQLAGAVATLEALEDALLRHFTGRVPEPGDDALIMAAQHRARARLRGMRS